MNRLCNSDANVKGDVSKSLYKIDLSLFKINRKVELVSEVALDMRKLISLELSFFCCLFVIHF